MTRTVAILIAALSVALPSAAVGAPAPIDEQYGNPTDAPTLGTQDTPTATPTSPGLVADTSTTPDTVAGLPFTGAELGMIAVAGLLVGSAGLAVRRIARQDRQRSHSDVS